MEKAQKRVEEHNFEIRKNLIKYDEVMNQQREVIYSYRRSVLKGYSLKNEVKEMIQETVLKVIANHIHRDSYVEDWNLDRLCYWFKTNFNLQITPEDLNPRDLDYDILEERLLAFCMQAYENKELNVGEETLRDIERRSMLEVVDNEWRDHLHEMDMLKEAVYLRSYANKDPLIEYKRESFELFQELISRIQEGVSRKVYTTYFLTAAQVESLLQQAKERHEDLDTFLAAKQAELTQNATAPPQYSSPNEAVMQEKQRPVRVAEKVGRNDPCPCGSGKKYKRCCGLHEED